MKFINCYAPQCGLSAGEKDTFHDKIISLDAAVPDEERLLIDGDFIGHVGVHCAGFNCVHGSNGYVVINQDGLGILDFCVANKLAVANTFFQNNISKLVTYLSGGNHTQVDYILVKRSNLSNIKETRAISCE